MSGLLDLLTDACAGLPCTPRKMFGGHGFFAPNGGMFAGIVSSTEVIFKFADETARTELIAEGGHPWVYGVQDKPMTMSPWIVVPERFYDDPEAFAAWARRAHALVPGKLAKKRGAKKPAVAAKPAKKKPVTKPKKKPSRARKT
jgi:TfoX/Sxy family transcriptional regulator of competence genes